jgi:6-pyruvoyltetrahydropterin/6-carboxytetrahydropterin synthase
MAVKSNTRRFAIITQTQTFTIEVAHRFPTMPKESKHFNLHGHSYYCDLTVTGELDKFGFICDFEELDKACQNIKQSLDHKILNDVIGDTPTMEVLAQYILGKFYEKQKSLGGSFFCIKNLILVSIQIYRPSVGQKVKLYVSK